MTNQMFKEIIEERIKKASKTKFMYLEKISSSASDEDNQYNSSEYLKYLAIEQELKEIIESVDNEEVK